MTQEPSCTATDGLQTDAHTHTRTHTPAIPHPSSSAFWPKVTQRGEGSAKAARRSHYTERRRESDDRRLIYTFTEHTQYVSFKRCSHHHQNSTRTKTLGCSMYSWTCPGWRVMFHTDTKLLAPFVWHLQTIRLPHCPPEVGVGIKRMCGEDRSCTARKIGERNILVLLKRFQKLNRSEFVHIKPPYFFSLNCKEKKGIVWFLWAWITPST